MESLEEAVYTSTAIVKSAKDCILTVASDTFKIISANPSSEAVFGCSNAQLVGSPFNFLLSHEPQGLTDKDKSSKDIIDSLLNVKKEMVAKRSDGTDFPVKATMSEVLVSNSHFYTLTIQDLSREKKQEAKIKQMNKNLEKNSRKNAPTEFQQQKIKRRKSRGRAPF